MIFRTFLAAGLLASIGTAHGRTAPDEPSVLAPALGAFVRWASADRATAGHTPWAVLDKKNARLYVFDPSGALLAASPVLLGSAIGDDSVPGIGDRPIADIRPFERTTPAGRFKTEPGTNLQGEDIVWVDYDAAISMHRVRPLKGQRRLERLATPGAGDNRISYGCINVPAAFYDRWVRPGFGSAAGLLYVLPETRTVGAQFRAPPASQLR